MLVDDYVENESKLKEIISKDYNAMDVEDLVRKAFLDGLNKGKELN